MAKQCPKLWNEASKAREKLDAQLQQNQEVCSVDIGYSPEAGDTEEISLRIHLSPDELTSTAKGYPDQVNGIPVSVVQKS